MGRRPKVWNIRSQRRDGWIRKHKDLTKEISKFDIDKIELLPFFEPKRRVHHRYGIRYAPIENYLMNQIGRDYDEIYSELKQRIPRRDWDCVRLDNYKMPNSFHPSVSRWFLNDKWWSRIENTEGFYVDLATNTLGFIEKISKHGLEETEKAKPVYKPFEMEKFKIRHDYNENYVFQQLLTYDDFVQEALKMKHCIRTYFTWCTDFDNKRSIWSVSLASEKILTVEVVEKQIVQVRGLRNRRANEAEKLIIQKWANWLRLMIAEYAI